MTYNILDFGAEVSDRLQTKEIQSAIDRCFLDGGGEVIIPAGVFRTGSIRLRSNVNLHLLSGAILEGSDNPEDYNNYIDDEVEPLDVYDPGDEKESVYPFSRWNNGIIRAFNAENVSVTGDEGSYIDGVNCYDADGEEGYRGPHGINMYWCKNIRLEGYTLRNCGNWAHAIFKSSGITAKNLTVYGGHDGFDVRTCDDVLIEDCKFCTGDDCIAGFDNHNVTVRNCYLNCACNAIRFGGTNVHIENCDIDGNAKFGHRYTMTDNDKRIRTMPSAGENHIMHSVFCYYCDFRAEIRHTPGNIVMKNCRIDCSRAVFVHDFGTIWTCNRELEHFRMENCILTGIRSSVIAHIGDKDSGGKLVLEFENVDVTADTNAENTVFAHLKYFKRLFFNNVTAKDFKSFDIRKDLGDEDGEIIIENSSPFSVMSGM